MKFNFTSSTEIQKYCPVFFGPPDRYRNSDGCPDAIVTLPIIPIAIAGQVALVQGFMFYCYLLFSQSLDRFYIGSTHESLDERISKHNTGYYPGRHCTHQASDWKLHVSIECKTYSQAPKIENHIKRMKSRKFMMDLKRYPEISERLLSKYAD